MTLKEKIDLKMKQSTALAKSSNLAKGHEQDIILTENEIRELKRQRVEHASMIWLALQESFTTWKYGEKLLDNRTWAEALLYRTKDQLNKGLKKTLEQPRDFAPTLPVFIFNCVMADVPPKYELYETFQKNPNSNIFSAWIKKNISSYYSITQNELTRVGMFEEAYQKLYLELLNNEVIEDFREFDRLQEERPTTITPEQRKKTASMLKQIRKELSALINEKQVD